MAKDYEDIGDTDHLIDNELRALVRDQFETQLAFDPDDVDVSVHSGVVRVSGRVGTEEELRKVERVITDLVGLENLESELVVDPIRRAESPKAIGGAIRWNPPDGPTPEGVSGMDATPNVMNDNR